MRTPNLIKNGGISKQQHDTRVETEGRLEHEPDVVPLSPEMRFVLSIKLINDISIFVQLQRQAGPINMANDNVST